MINLLNLTSYELEKQINKNHVATPNYIVADIFKRINIKQFNKIWLPFDNYDSEFTILATKMGLTFVNTHIYDENSNDFFKTTIECDLLISNPPFNLQNDILTRVLHFLDLGVIKSFCLLLPLSTLETLPRSRIYQKLVDKLSIGIFSKRITFKYRVTAFNNACCWVCYNIPGLQPLWWC